MLYNAKNENICKRLKKVNVRDCINNTKEKKLKECHFKNLVSEKNKKFNEIDDIIKEIDEEENIDIKKDNDNIVSSKNIILEDTKDIEITKEEIIDSETKKGNMGSSFANNKKKNGIILLSAIAVIVVCLAIVLCFESNSKDNSLKNNNKNDVLKVNNENVEENEEKNVTLIAVGDNLYHSYVYNSGKTNNGYDFEHLYKNIKPTIEKADISVVNQETVFSLEGKEPTDYPSFSTPQEVATSLKNAGFDVATQATNHTADVKPENILHTIDVWNNLGDMTVVGINKTEEDVKKIAVVEKNGIKIAMLNYTYGLNGNKIEPEYMINTFPNNEERVKSDIANAKKIADFVIVFPHWGTEYRFEPDDFQEKWTKIFAESGVDLVIGTHPHVIEPVKWIDSEKASGGKMLVYYSLGNFVSCQTECSRLVGGMAHVTITKKGDETNISKASVSSTIMHYEKTPSTKYTVYPLEDYTEDLAKFHAVNAWQKTEKFSLENAKKCAENVFGSVSEIEISKN